MPKLLILFLVILVLSCSSIDKMPESTYGTVAVPVIAGYSSYIGAKSIYQGSAIALHLPDTLYAEEIGRGELMRLVPVDNVFAPFLAYMGARDGYDYYVYLDYMNGKSQRIVKVKRTSELEIKTLTINPYGWEEIEGLGMDMEFKLNHRLYPYLDDRHNNIIDTLTN